MNMAREITDGSDVFGDDPEGHACARLSEAALNEWLSHEEDVAWAHLQQEGNASEPAFAQLHGLPGEEMLRFAGTISRDDLDQMERIIEEECERIDPEEW
jgi:hypothetical protein